MDVTKFKEIQLFSGQFFDVTLAIYLDRVTWGHPSVIYAREDAFNPVPALSPIGN